MPRMKTRNIESCLAFEAMDDEHGETDAHLVPADEGKAMQTHRSLTNQLHPWSRHQQHEGLFLRR